MFRGDPRVRSAHGVEAVNRHSRTWNGVTVHALEIYVAPGGAWSDLSSELASLSIVLDEIDGHVEPRLKVDRPLWDAYSGPRYISFSPAGMTLWGYTDGCRCVREARLDIDLSALSVKLGEDLSRMEAQTPRLRFHDDRISRVGELLAAQCKEPDELSQLYGDSLTVALFIDLLRLGKRAEATQQRGGLARWQLRRVTEYMRENLSASVHLRELAELTGLSQSQFGRAFKASTGLPPHRWQMNARIAKAQELLLQGSMPLSQIALDTGFAEQSHFTRVFRRVVGASPGAWQRERRT